MRDDAVFKKTFNTLLDHLVEHGERSPLEPEAKLAEALKVSRTTVRKALAEAEQRGLVGRHSGRLQLVKRPARKDYFPSEDTVATSDRVEQKFLEWILRGDRKPDQQINGLELAREFNVSTIAIRDYLNRFTRFGLVEKRANSGWIIRGFTKEFALELFEVRELFELRSALAFATQPIDAPAWASLRRLEQEHRALLADVKTRYQDFSNLDERFHRLINDASKNRFIEDFHDVISLIFHYHYQWNKADERERNAVAITEHLNYIKALQSRNPEKIEKACRKHLASARETLLRSII
ncbi:MAG TPA: GntR family transcriptional regulator [Dongiaceae bacterium]|jgi:DNA-binding GntR family transcriptional regulator|nr:GntR family transcriptional regulator [Dongiaceae bacterium]